MNVIWSLETQTTV